MLKTYIKFFIILVITFHSNKSSSQNQTDNWYFGTKAGLNFSTCTPTVLTNGQLSTLEGVATISDVNGNLLFYTDGIKVWNKTHAVMQNGTGLYGNGSSTQSAVIIPKPGNPSIYFIFTIDAVNSGNFRGLNYSIVDISLNAGLGAVTNKNTLLLSEAWEKLTAVRHQNNNDFWVITRGLNSNNYYSWQVTSSGVTLTPITSPSPNFLPFDTDYSVGYLKPSTDGKMLFCAISRYPFSEMAKFNDATGAVTNIIKFKNKPSTSFGPGLESSYGVEFSPNNKFMYVSTRIQFTNTCNTCYAGNTTINQYDVSIFDSTAIANSIVFLDSSGTPAHPLITVYGALQLAKNGKIYIAQSDETSLSVIANPDVQGIGCNFQKDGQALNFRFSQQGLPTFIQSYFNPNYRVYDFNYTEDCQLNVSFSLNTIYPYDSLRWFFGDVASGTNNTSTNPNQIHSYNTTGARIVKLYLYNKYGCVNKIDSVVKQIPVGNQWFSFGADKLLCQGDSLQLNATTVNANTYTWNTGASTPTIKIFGAGIYWCEVTKGLCSYRDSIIITTKPLPIINFGIDQTLCEGKQIILDVFNAGATYTWQDNSNTDKYIVTNMGQYSVTVDLNGCLKRDTIKINYELKPRFSLGNDKSICTGLSILLDPKIEDVSYTWQDGSTAPTYTVFQPGFYHLTAKNNCGFKKDSINISAGNCTVYFPNSFTPNGDKKNDVFKAFFIDDVSTYELQVYNRYGQIIFKTNDKNTGWNGMFKGQEQSMGSYVWVAKYKTLSKGEMMEMRGTISLLR